uniref:G_PROTEIN_RECEP_F1_2 domain-containing protein n=1 Tax=Heterorhabditis bacteriophora TaxID=37862 RepID=A0A1I7XF85_HETBA
MHHLISSFSFIKPCEVYLKAKTCFPYMVVNSLATSYLTSVQVCMCIERLVATIMIKKYEAYSGHLVWLLITVAIVLMGTLIYTTFAEVPLDEDFLTCISIPALASQKTNRNFLILISLNFLSIISLGALNFMNQKYRVKIYKDSLNEVKQRSLIMYAYSVPYFTCLLPILMMFILSQGIKSRNQSINQLVSHATSGVTGSNNYFNDLRKAWQ